MDWPSISLIVCTFRPGGLDLLSESLRCQDYAGAWEVLIMDELYGLGQRQELVQDLVTQRVAPRVVVRHMPNPRSVFPRCSTVTARNEAIVQARGEIAVFLTDYAVCRSDFLTRHARAHVQEADLVLNGAFWSVWPARLAPGLRCPLDPTDRGLADRFTIFDHSLGLHEAWALPLQGRTRPEGPTGQFWTREFTGQDVASMSRPEGRVGSDGTYLKNDSIPLVLLRQVGGVDEAYAGLHRCDDTDLGLRLAAAGAVFRHSKAVGVKLVQVRCLMRSLVTDDDAKEAGEQALERAKERVRGGDFFACRPHPDLERFRPTEGA